jgi:hypothetical protein
MKDHRPVGTWLQANDYQKLEQFARNNNVSIASYVRGIIIDAIQDESSCISKATDPAQLDLQFPCSIR